MRIFIAIISAKTLSHYDFRPLRKLSANDHVLAHSSKLLHATNPTFVTQYPVIAHVPLTLCKMGHTLSSMQEQEDG